MPQTPPPAIFRRLIRRALDAAYPPMCLACAAPTAAHGALCASCWRAAEFLDPRQVCDGCGSPLEARALLNAAGDQSALLCDFCVKDRLFPGRIRSALIYSGPARAITLRLKYGDALYMAPTLARWMARAAKDIAPDIDVITPTPLHWSRHWRRRYNQAAELSRALSKQLGKAHGATLLTRIRATPSQEGKSRGARHANVSGAFNAQPCPGARIALVDDVATTGATLAACAAALFEAGAASVDAITLTRATLREFNSTDSPSVLRDADAASESLMVKED